MTKDNEKSFLQIEDEVLLGALTALSRAINTRATYGETHPAFQQAFDATYAELQKLFLKRKKVYIGAFSGVMTIDEKPVNIQGTLLKSLEKRLTYLEITNLRIASGISEYEFRTLVNLLANKEAEEFRVGMKAAGLSHVANEQSVYQAVREGHTVAHKGDLAGGGVLVLDDEMSGGDGEGSGGGASTVHVEQIVAFIKGDVGVEAEDVQDDLKELAADPDKLGQMIMESVAIQQTTSELSGESLSDIILGCLRRTYQGLRKSPAFKGADGKADLKKSLLLLEESILEKMRDIAGPDQPELDRKIVQAVREMDENLDMEILATRYVEHRAAVERSEKKIASYIRSKGMHAAQEVLADAEVPPKDWHRIVVQSNRDTTQGGTSAPTDANLGTLALVLEKLEHLMQSEGTDNGLIKELVDHASSNMVGLVDSTKDKLDKLAKRIQSSDDDTGTVGGNSEGMSRTELLSEIAEIAQELMQPLTAINASIEMILCGYAGELTPGQKDLIILASGSGDHLRDLMYELITIVGFPVNLGTDERYTRHRNKKSLN
ncbi:MAG: hypothetical protein K9M45_08090 [Kiritimatiellales bacterium]|nr:hypothetical protein [Kiritimatiellales bacterium]